MPENSILYAGYPNARVFAAPDGKKFVQELIWGDWIRLLGESRGTGKNKYLKIEARDEKGWILAADTQPDPLLNVYFVDVGQGDGTLITAPDGRELIIDAGIGDNMQRFLEWQSRTRRKPIEFDTAILSHPDQDHYAGFSHLFKSNRITFRNVYHNGIMEREAKRSNDSLGQRVKSGGRTYITDLVRNMSDLKSFFKTVEWKGKNYPKMLHAAVESSHLKNFRMLSNKDRYVPGYGPGSPVQLQVLGTVLEKTGDGQPALRWLSRAGKTKNGHSVVLRLLYGKVRILLGGDLNSKSEELLIQHYTGKNLLPDGASNESEVVEAAREHFEVDVAKACHHGSHDFRGSFLKSLNAIATVVSSGDNEPYSHPRSDALGAIGKYSRGARPLIFSTELMRSAQELIKHPNVLKAKMNELVTEISELTGSDEKTRKKKAARLQQMRKLIQEIRRSIAVYGTISLRTDGKRVVIAQKLERSARSRDWDIYRLEPKPGADSAELEFHRGS